LKSKDEVFGKFKEFKALIENLFERKIKILRSDNGGEYTSKEFVSFCRDVGIKRELTTPTKWCSRKKEKNNNGSCEEYDPRSRSSIALMGRSSKNNSVCLKPPKKCSSERSQK
jgi:transposase InsO family protein